MKKSVPPTPAGRSRVPIRKAPRPVDPSPPLHVRPLLGPTFTILATATFGLEAVVADELRNLGYDELEIQNGRVAFQGTWRDVARANLWLRVADRVLIRLAEFPCRDFKILFDEVAALEWGEFIPENGRIHVVGKSIQSQLHSVPTCQSVVKKAIIDALKRRYQHEWFRENGPTYKIEVGLLKDIATITLDTSGAGLHKRGYRSEAGGAPLKETLAAALVFLSRWDSSRPFLDPFCGSGTIPIEAALMVLNRAPGLYRAFAAEDWSIPHGKEIWADARAEAKAAECQGKRFKVHGSDIDPGILRVARRNAEAAGVTDYVEFHDRSVADATAEGNHGVLIANPPYGERLELTADVEKIYHDTGELFRKLRTWSCFVLTAHEEFEKAFGSRATKNRKLYNGNIKCYLYQYFGELPRAEKRLEGKDSG